MHIALPVLAIHIQGDDGTALIFAGIGVVMLFAGGLSLPLALGGLGLAAAGGAALLLAKPTCSKATSSSASWPS